MTATISTQKNSINAYRDVKEVLRRKAIRLGKDASEHEGKEEGDEPQIKSS